MRGMVKDNDYGQETDLTFRLLLMSAQSAGTSAINSTNCVTVEASSMYPAVSLIESRLSVHRGVVPGVPVGEGPVNDDDSTSAASLKSVPPECAC